MRLHLSDSTLLDDLLACLRSLGCVAYATESDRLDVVVPDSVTERAARLQLRAYVELWRERHPGAEVVVVAD